MTRALVTTAHAAALTLHPVRTSHFDLEVRGRVDFPGGAEVGYIRPEDLAALATVSVMLQDDFSARPVRVTGVPLLALWKALPVRADADCLLAACSDRYLSLFRKDFVDAYQPFVVTGIEGHGPRDWGRIGLTDDPGPYVITVSETLAPAAAHYLSIEHKKPWGVVSIEFASFENKFGGAFRGAWAHLGPQASAGREIWLNACECCHTGPPGTTGGMKSHEVFPIVAAVARGDPGLFRRYVRDPSSVNPAAKMQAHPYFTDAELDELIAFVLAGRS